MKNNETLKLARNYLGLSQTGLAKKIGVSQAVVSNIEKGNKPLTEDLIQKLKSVFSRSFFSVKNHGGNLNLHYRSSANISKKMIDLFESRVNILANNICEILEYVDIPVNTIPTIGVEDFDYNAKELALYVRRYLGIGVNPIDEIVSLLERNGVIVYFYEFDFISSQNKNFDGVSFYVEDVPVILINKKIQNARKVFTISHELCHLIAHRNINRLIETERDLEKEANTFASEFVIPTSEIKNEFYRLTLEKLFSLKAKWKLSVSALLYKGRSVGLTKDQYRRWVTRLSPYRKEEPFDVSMKSPVLLKKMINVCKEELGGEREFLKTIGISETIYNELYSTIEGEEYRSKLKIIL
ncbi:XRE family transcriptional regulator [Tenacibaculum sp. ZH5_bin.1]|uniref:XRE family transcriptional regulator n=1 Tax=Tenacibaculum TaxID=104267 RepID=UPI0014311AC2|nr:XRE family transcriptional regulator [Tenacibaculum mesophilum]KAF9659592.1 ImmA/IrrE family metallo-endopeptidase [Tenacibaculum mesophilum]